MKAAAEAYLLPSAPPTTVSLAGYTDDVVRTADAPERPVVCHVIESLEHGGAESLVHRLAVGVRDAYDPIVCCFRDGPLGERIARDGVRVERWNMRRATILNPLAFGRFAYTLIRRLTTTIRQHRVAIVHAHLSDAIIPAAIAGAITGTPVIGTYHGLGVLPARHWFDPRNALRRSAYSMAERLSSRTIAVSPPIRDLLCTTFGFSALKTVLIMNGVDVAEFSRAARCGSERRGSGRTVTCVARLVRTKGQQFLIEAVAAVRRTYPDVRLKLVGGGPYEPELRQLVATLGLSQHVEFAANRTDIPEILAATDVFVLPSFSEGISLALTEAMAAAVPVVVTDVPGNREVVGDERHAMLVPVADAAALAQAIDMLLANPERARQQGLRGRERVQERFDFRRALDKTLALYDEVIAERRGARETTRA